MSIHMWYIASLYHAHPYYFCTVLHFADSTNYKLSDYDVVFGYVYGEEIVCCRRHLLLGVLAQR